jgi:hypothetical protein
VAAALSGSPGYFGFPVDRNPWQSFLSRSFQAHQAGAIISWHRLLPLTKEQLHPSCCGSHLLGVYLLEHSLMFLFVRTSLGSLLIGNRPE